MQIPFMPKAPPEEIERRRAICRACEHLGTIPVINQPKCNVCGCPILTKTQLLNSHCPKGKW